MAKRKYSSIEYILLALVPYSQPNIMLSYKPNKFFNELERITQTNRASLQSALSRAKQQGYVAERDRGPLLTNKGLERISPYTAKTLKKNVQLMVAFDIPEGAAYKRRQFRSFLRQHKFKQAQKSVWITDSDYRKALKNEIEYLKIAPYVDVFECAKVAL